MIDKDPRSGNLSFHRGLIAYTVYHGCRSTIVANYIPDTLQLWSSIACIYFLFGVTSCEKLQLGMQCQKSPSHDGHFIRDGEWHIPSVDDDSRMSRELATDFLVQTWLLPQLVRALLQKGSMQGKEEMPIGFLTLRPFFPELSVVVSDIREAEE